MSTLSPCTHLSVLKAAPRVYITEIEKKKNYNNSKIQNKEEKKNSILNFLCLHVHNKELRTS